MRRTSKLAVLLLTMLFLPASAQENGAMLLSENPLAGRKVFVSKGCINCHAVWGTGGTFGPDLVRISRNRTFFEIVGLLWNHSPRMSEMMAERGTERPELSVEEMRELITYLYYLNYFNEPGDYTRGKGIFREKGCDNCHAVNGKKVGPSLDAFQQEMSPMALAQTLWNHGPEMAEAFKLVGLKRFSFTGNDIADLLAYLRGTSSGVVRDTPSYAAPGNSRRGRELFREKRCGQCHATDATSRLGPGLGRKEAHQSVVDFAALMWNHGPSMWATMRAQGVAFPKFSGNEMSDVAAYIYSLRFFDRSGDPAKGKLLFEQKRCVLCHSMTGENSVGPDLAHSETLRSPMEVATAMWNHAPVMKEVLEENNLPWPTLGEQEMSHILAYIERMRNKKAP